MRRPENMLLALLAAGPTLLALAPASQRPAEFIAAQHPAAVMAWGQMRCQDPAFQTAPAMRSQADDVLQVAAIYDEALRYRSLETLCAEAARDAGLRGPSGGNEAQDGVRIASAPELARAP